MIRARVNVMIIVVTVNIGRGPILIIIYLLRPNTQYAGTAR